MWLLISNPPNSYMAVYTFKHMVSYFYSLLRSIIIPYSVQPAPSKKTQATPSVRGLKTLVYI